MRKQDLGISMKQCPCKCILLNGLTMHAAQSISHKGNMLSPSDILYRAALQVLHGCIIGRDILINAGDCFLSYPSEPLSLNHEPGLSSSRRQSKKLR